MLSGMSRDQFRKYGKEAVDYIADYYENISKRPVTPAVEPGYLRKKIPHEAPQKGEPWEKIMEDFDKWIMPGMTHWQHPQFHAYFPLGSSFPSLLASFIGDGASCPAFTELEPIMLHWFGKMMGLPKEFLPLTEGGNGGGVIQASASDCTFVCLLAARHQKIEALKKESPYSERGLLLSKLRAYISKKYYSKG
ncbi:pyridoxal-dependent decarboxylase domain protein [Oesophagostomum dentatum]|uniref:Pyridoxal-dependent decarboxylase domain protein n=1 Tax=Oesophagostomum dentatum TaxID=61180 RepID=A0A0B1TH85_OESDE|nr:pyridoxal-dependent decarboxylase domain protein [Oesophagostomum dentatum]